MTEATDETIVAGNVISSDPVADAEVAPGSEVGLRRSPSDRPRCRARSRRSPRGRCPHRPRGRPACVAGDRSEASDASIVAGNVISSDPAAAAEVAPGSEVSYVALPRPGHRDRARSRRPPRGRRPRRPRGGRAGARVTAARPPTRPSSRATSSAPIRPPTPRWPAVARSATSSPSARATTTGARPRRSPRGRCPRRPRGRRAGAPVTATEATDETIVAGNVISSDPAAAAEVARGSEVSYVALHRPARGPVPDLVDLPEADALAALEDGRPGRG